MKNYLSLFTRRTADATPQALPIPGTVPNAAGGHAFPVDDWTRLDRFLILGSEGGSYYAAERPLTRDNAQAVLRAIAADGARAVARIVEISEGGRAARNDPALFALALAAYGLGVGLAQPLLDLVDDRAHLSVVARRAQQEGVGDDQLVAPAVAQQVREGRADEGAVAALGDPQVARPRGERVGDRQGALVGRRAVAPEVPQVAALGTALPAPARAGRPLTYSIVVTNRGPGDSTGVILTEELDPNVEFVSATASQGIVTSSGDGPVTVDLGTLIAGQSVLVTIVVRPTAIGTITSTASVRGDLPDFAPADNSVTITSLAEESRPPAATGGEHPH